SGIEKTVTATIAIPIHHCFAAFKLNAPAEIPAAMALKTPAALTGGEYDLPPLRCVRDSGCVTSPTVAVIGRPHGDNRSLERRNRSRYVGQRIGIGLAGKCLRKQTPIQRVGLQNTEELSLTTFEPQLYRRFAEHGHQRLFLQTVEIRIGPGKQRNVRDVDQA